MSQPKNYLKELSYSINIDGLLNQYSFPEKNLLKSLGMNLHFKKKERIKEFY